MDRPFPAYNGDEPYIFVSYSHKDNRSVYPELAWLKEQGINIWIAVSVLFDQQPDTSPEAPVAVEADEPMQIPLEERLSAACSIAVLPFTNLSANEETGFLAKGLSEDILDRLAKWEGMNVATPSASFQFDGEGQDLEQVAQNLNVTYLL